MSSIIIIGGGPAGLALCAGLSQFPSNEITVIEKSNYFGYVFGEHLQSEVLPLFSDLKIPTRLLFENSTSCDGILGLWAGRRVLSNNLFKLYGHDFIVHRPQFEKSLTDYLRKERGVRFFFGTTARKIEKGKLSTGDNNLPYDYLFDCSGRTSQQFFNQRLIFDKLIGISYFISSKSENNAKVLIESAANGWWYYTQSKKAKIVTFLTDSDIYKKLRNDIQQELDKTSLIKKYCNRLNGSPQVKNAYTSILRATPSGILQVGDSYYSLDPLSSQGIYKAFNQALEITRLFSEDTFAESIFKFYEKQRKNFLKQLFSREYHYREGLLWYESEFYQRRLGLNLLSAPGTKSPTRRSSLDLLEIVRENNEVESEDVQF